MTRTTTPDAPSAARPAPKGAIAAAAAARPDLAPLINGYFRHVAPEDQPDNADDILAIVSGHSRLGSRRQPGQVLIRSHNPPPGGDGWSGTSTVVDIVNDDMPYLVDSVVAELTAAGITVHRVLHPILCVRRDRDGALLEVTGESRWEADPAGNMRESWMHLLIDRLTDASRVEDVEADLHAALSDVRWIVTDTPAMTAIARQAAAELRAGDPVPPGTPQAADTAEAADLLDWMASGNVTFVGYRRERPTDGGTDSGATGLGLLRPETAADIEPVIGAGAEPDVPLAIGQFWLATPVSRDTPTLSVTVSTGVPRSDGHGRHRFLVNLTPQARNSDVAAIPVLRTTMRTVLSQLGATPDSYSGQRAIEVLSTYPRAELFWADRAQVAEVVAGQLQLSSRRRLRVFLQPDPRGRFISALVFLPRDRYTTARRLAMQQTLLDALGGEDIRYTARIGDSLMAAVHFTVTTDPEHRVEVSLADLTRQLRETVRSWEDRLVSAVVGGDEDLDTAGALSRYADAFDEAYKEDYTVADAVEDLKRLDQLTGPDDLALSILPPPDGSPGDRRLKLYVAGAAVSLSRAMPVLQQMGVEVIDERPYEVRRSDGTPSHIYDFGLALGRRQLPADAAALTDVKRRFAEAFIAAWRGRTEVDGFNALVLAAGLDWRAIAVLRAYAKYLRQIGSPYTQGYIEQVLSGNPQITADLAALFAARFDPDVPSDDRMARCDALTGRITTALDAVSSLDADRILRTYVHLINATDRSNAFRADPDGTLRDCLAFKLDPHRVPGVPKPVPAHEIWVYSPRVEGVHLRFGAVARGGLRWSDRPEDFRTEVLGLVKAQEVKNAVIVPVGAKGGFVVKQPPVPSGDPAADRDALQAEGVACYRTFISCLLDVTDNRVSGAVLPPEGVVRHDGDDPYLVVAADKGTAKFSDIANAVALEYGFWLGDAFASGGSAGYDHKGMGITARGAWESVKHHFREMGVDTQRQDFTCVGIGDMSGDVFGNGMMLSEHIRLVAAFDHRHVFVDPDPDAAAGFRERRRLFELPRSSWADYDGALISEGGGVWPRTAKSIPVSGQMRAALGLSGSVQSLSPAELIRAVLLAPVDLLWNGGIGTYIKASTETNAQVGDKANDPVRVDAADLRVKVVGEGGNLGVTQLGRIEFARAGGKINTDAMDNSAGVDTSDHEVNIKIALQPLLAGGALSQDGRNELLTAMTDEVAELVLADNTAQNRLLGVSRAHAGPMLSVHARQIDDLVQAGRLDRDLEFLPAPAEIDARIAAGEGLTSPELSVLVAYTKSLLAAEMIASDLPDDPAYATRLPGYFPSAMRARFADAIAAHPLARDIVTTMTANEVVNRAGISFAFRLGEEIAASPTDAIRAYTVTSTVFDLPALLTDIDAADHVVPAGCQDQLTLLLRRLLDRAARWFLSRRPQPLDVTSEIDRYAGPVRTISPRMADLLRGVERDNVRRDTDQLLGLGATEDLAVRVAYSLYTFSILDIADVSAGSGRDLWEVAQLYYALSAHLDFDHMLTQVTELERGDRWHALARQAIRDDLYRSMWMITADVLSTTDPGTDADAAIAQWEQQNASRLSRARSTLTEIADAGAGDLAALSVAAREIRTMIR
jgi:glutamate dehydrogenase